MVKEMARHALPVPSVGDEPLIDDEGMFGYRMELLFPIDFSDLNAISRPLRNIVSRLHNCRFSHGDLNPSNIMRNGQGGLVLIDPSLSGQLGQQVPDFIPQSQYESTVFDTTTDENYLDKFFLGCNSQVG